MTFSRTGDSPTDSKTENARLTQEYLDIVSAHDGDVPGRRAARAFMDASPAVYHGSVVKSSFIPRIFDQATHDEFAHVAHMTHRILCKVIKRYLDGPSYRDVFTYDPRLRKIILFPRDYDSVLPMLRVDVFLNENTLESGFCELNADGTSGMLENECIERSIKGSDSFVEFSKRHRVKGCELFDSWVREFMGIYSTYRFAREHPHIAICDYTENATTAEFERFARTFEKHGYECRICDVRELKFDGTVLTDAHGWRIDAIWRRSVTNDIIAHWDESQDLISAVEARKVALIGNFASHIVHDKQIFRALYDPKTAAFLTPEENAFVAAHVPMTTFLDSDHIDLDRVKRDKDQLISKPSDHYGASDVHAGRDMSQKAWDAFVDAHANGAAGEPFLIQRFVQPFKTKVLPPCMDMDGLSDDQIPTQTAMYNNMSGIYVYNGTFQGVYSRLGPQNVISAATDDITMATEWVDCDV